MRTRNEPIRNGLLSRSNTPQGTVRSLGGPAAPRFDRGGLGAGKTSPNARPATAPPVITHDLSRLGVGNLPRPSLREPVSEDELGTPTQETTRQPPGGGSAAPVPRAPAPAATTVNPTGIASTRVTGPTPSLGPTYYGSVFAHTLTTSGGTITGDITIAEKVTVTRDDFNTGFTGVALGTLTWGPGGTANIAGNDIHDNIGTGPINATHFVPGPPGLPAIMETPQELHYRVGTGPWKKFADVPMIVTLRDAPSPLLYAYEVETRVNNVPSTQEYTGPE